MDSKNNKNIYSIASKILGKLDSSREYPSTKASLANLRNSIGKSSTQSVEIFPIIYEYMPEDFIGNEGRLTPAEKSILTVIQLYALHQQGKFESVLHKRTEEYKYKKNIGDSFRALRGGESKSIDSRFNALITSDSFEEMSHHLRQMVLLLKSKTQEPVDYPQLANDLYWFIVGRKENVCLDWARSYYKYIGDDKNDDN